MASREPRATIDRTDRHWFKDAVIYQLHVKGFFDSNNDGIGDFAGLIQKLDYLKDMGITALWLLPFYPSPQLDDGYDIADYRNIHPSYGTMSDFKDFISACHERGLRVITELVVNHTSNQHAWFERARNAKPGSNHRNYYVWSDTDQRYQGTRIIFLDTEKSNWTWDEKAKAYYWHRFYSHQPDLNFDNPNVLKEVIRVLNFWLEMGVDGMRLDAVPYLIEREGTNNENLSETHEVLRRIRAEVDAKFPDRMLLAEANQWPEDVLPYFGNGDECHMAFHFPLMPRMYMAIAQEDRHPITDIMRQTPDIPENCQWAIFLRNHDELTLEMVTDKERDYLWNYYATDRGMRINLGIRRRLAPLMESDRRKIELMTGLLMALPGTPVIYYGDELGMGDNFYLGDRNGVRTPMQWSPDRNGGFSRADMARLYLPPIMDPVYGFDAVNVESQTRSPSSLLNWTKRLLAVRQGQRVFGRGTMEFLYPGNRKILAFVRSYEDRSILCVFNLSRAAQAVELDLAQYKPRTPVELMGRSAFPPIGDLPYLLTLPSYGFFWFVLAPTEELPKWHLGIPEPVPEFVTLVARDGWKDIVRNPALALLEKESLPRFIALQRWFAAKDTKITGARIVDSTEMKSDTATYLLSEVEVKLANDGTQRYFLPLALASDAEASAGGGAPVSFMLAHARRGAKLLGLFDASVFRDFSLALLRAISEEQEIPGNGGRIRCTGSEALRQLKLNPDAEVRRMSVEQSNSSILIADAVMIKLYRRPVRGIHPEVEFGLFLRDANYQNTPPMLGAAQHIDDAGVPAAFAIVQGFVRNQGDGWTHAVDYLIRWFEDYEIHTPDGTTTALEPHYIRESGHDFYFDLIATLGRRVGELHRVLARRTGDATFEPEAITAGDAKAWLRVAQQTAHDAFEALASIRANLSGDTKTAVESLMARKKECLDLLGSLNDTPISAVKTRIHGDLHLGQVLLTQKDWIIIDFEGEPTRPLDARREKQMPLKDVAGLIRSFDYAARSALRRTAATVGTNTQPIIDQAMSWRDHATNTFLKAYGETAQNIASFPEEATQRRRWLDFFVLEKACYELRYEAANRPDWLEIPIAGITAILDSYSS